MGAPALQFSQLTNPGAQRASTPAVQLCRVKGSKPWNSPATPGIYSIEVDVEDQGATDTYEKVNSTTFSIT